MAQNESTEQLDELLKELPSEKKEIILGLIERDPMTKLYRKDAFESRLENLIYKADRGKQDVTVLLIDFDGFKQYNDAHGHLPTNEVLKEIVDDIKINLRKEEKDNMGRFGGDEFMVYLDDSDISAGYAVAERIRNSVQQKFKDKYGITLSIGVASYESSRNDSRPNKEKTLDLIDKADKAMYLVKQEGKNGVEPYNPKDHSTNS